MAKEDNEDRTRAHSSVGGSKRPPGKEVAEFHTNSDVDSSASAQHHTLGTGQNNAAFGSHRHDGSDSVQLGQGIIISGSKGGNAAIASIVAAMVQILGVKDETT